MNILNASLRPASSLKFGFTPAPQMLLINITRFNMGLAWFDGFGRFGWGGKRKPQEGRKVLEATFGAGDVVLLPNDSEFRLRGCSGVTSTT